MIDIYEVLKANERVCEELLKKQENATLEFAKWDEENEEYVSTLNPDGWIYDECPFIRYAYDEGNIGTLLVIAVRYNVTKRIIEIQTTTDNMQESDGVWFPISYADDISYYSIFNFVDDAIG